MNRVSIILFAILSSVGLTAKDKEKITLVFDEKANAYVEHSKSEYSYNSKGQLVQENQFGWDIYERRWAPIYQIFFEYDGNKLINKLAKSYYAPMDKWVNDTKTGYTYSNDTTVATMMVYNNYITKLSEWDNRRQEITVTTNKRIVSHKIYAWQSATNSYTLHEERVYIYDKKGNNIEIQVNGYHTTEWDEHGKFVYTYDKKRRPIETVYIDTAHKRMLISKYKHIYR